MHQVIGEILPLAVVVMVSPVNIIAAILLLFSTKPKAAAAAYLAGFAVGVGVVLVVFDLLGGQLDWSSSDTTQGGAAVRIVLGVLLFAAALRKLRKRREHEGPPELPRWMDGISSMAPGKAAVTGFTIGALNPKNLAMALAASLAISAASLPDGEVAVVVLVYVVLASVGVAAPLVTAVALGDRATPVLEGWRSWLERNNDVVMAVLYFVFAFVLVGNGLAKW